VLEVMNHEFMTSRCTRRGIFIIKRRVDVDASTRRSDHRAMLSALFENEKIGSIFFAAHFDMKDMLDFETHTQGI